MKGQLSADFFISLTLFILLTSYFLVRVLDIIPNFLNEERMQSLRGTAYAISELLINDVGEPPNWQTLELTQIKRIGLMDEGNNLTNFLSFDKISRMDAICDTNYTKFKELLGIDEDVGITIRDLNTGTDIASCWPSESMEIKQRAEILRNAAYKDGSELVPTEILIVVW